MPNSKEILDWHFNPSLLKYKGENLFTNSTIQEIDSSMIKLKTMGNSSHEDKLLPNQKDIEEIYRQFQNHKNLNSQELSSVFSRRDIRLFVWALDYSPSHTSNTILFSNDLFLAIKLIRSKWKDSFINSLWQIMLRNWVQLQRNKKQFRYLIDILNYQKNKYKGQNSGIKGIISSLMYFQGGTGQEEFAKTLVSKKINLHEAHQIFNQKETILSYNYFSRVALLYIQNLNNNYQTVTIEQLKAVYDFTESHNQNAATLNVCSEIINSSYATKFKTYIKKQSIKLIAKPDEKHRWTDSNLSVSEDQNVAKARKKLNSWIIAQFIQVFFNELVVDERRKRYWLKFSDKIDDIYFCGNRSKYWDLKLNDNIKDYLDSMYKITRRNQNTCALVIYSGDYVFVEFTDVGALYIYKQNNFKVNLNNLDSTDNLKRWSVDKYAIKKDTYGYSQYLTNPEGRAVHQGLYWEQKFDYWIRQYYD